MRLGAFWSRGAHWGHFWLRDGLRDGLHVLVIYHLLKKRRASFWYLGVKISGGGLKNDDFRFWREKSEDFPSEF